MNIIRTFIFHILAVILIIYLFFEFSEWEVTLFRSIVLFLIAYFVFWALSFFYDRKHFYKFPKLIGLIIYFFKELIFASLEIAWEVITPKPRMESGLIAIPLDAKTDLEITILASLISLTPGTLSLDVSEDREILYIHAVYIKGGDVEALKNSIKFGFEKRLLQIMR
jgi:multicomponent Na+:H+ antiporter subunit E